MKTGNTVQSLLKREQDFEDWIIAATQLKAEKFITVAVDKAQELPPLSQVCGLIITGSPAFITDQAPWNAVAAAYVAQVYEVGIPQLGICYGHQLIAQTFGGTVDFHTRGREIGTVQIQTTATAADDVLFRHLRPSFSAQVSHLQSVIDLPRGAVLLAGNEFDPHHAFRLGQCTWGIQFHPEFSAVIMQAYIAERWHDIAKEGLNPDRLTAAVKECELATSLLHRFATLAESGLPDQDAVSATCASS